VVTLERVERSGFEEEVGVVVRELEGM